MNKTWKAKFFTIWLGQAISVLSSSVLQMALIWHLSLKTGSAAILSLASMAGFLPTALLGIFAGTLVDRWSRKLTIIGADLFIALVSLTLVIVALFAEIPVWLVLVILFIRSIGTAFHTPAISAITPLKRVYRSERKLRQVMPQSKTRRVFFRFFGSVQPLRSFTFRLTRCSHS